jgi:hypothetical protein
MGWHGCINHFRAFLIEIGRVGVEHHGLDGEVPGVFLSVALLRLPLLHLQLPCNAQKTIIPTNNPSKMERQHADLIHSARDQRATAQSLTIGGANSGSGGVHHERSFFVWVKLKAREAEWFRRVSRGLRHLNGEAGMGEAAGPVVDGASTWLHPLLDHDGRGWEEWGSRGHPLPDRGLAGGRTKPMRDQDARPMREKEIMAECERLDLIQWWKDEWWIKSGIRV